jgi:hypothetical protein
MFPALHASWLDRILGGPPPEESRATCDTCVMCRPAGAVARGSDEGPYFDASSKCCTYLPQLSNFAVGAMLEDDSPGFAAGRASIEQRLDERDGVSPLGLARPWAYDLTYREAMKSADAFGRTPRLRCPHFQGGGCSIWAYREPTCSTWFCRHDRGARGRDYWDVVKRTLRVLELALARHAVLSVGLGGAALARLFDAPPDAGPPPAADWGDWAGRERAFFVACAAVARTTSYDELTALGGVELEVHLRLLADARGRLDEPELPHRLRRRLLHVLPDGDTTCHVTTYRLYDPLELPTPLVDALHRFDGRPNAEVVAEVRREHGVVLDADTLRRLVDFEVLG